MQNELYSALLFSMKYFWTKITSNLYTKVL